MAGGKYIGDGKDLPCEMGKGEEGKEETRGRARPGHTGKMRIEGSPRLVRFVPFRA